MTRRSKIAAVLTLGRTIEPMGALPIELHHRAAGQDSNLGLPIFASGLGLAPRRTPRRPLLVHLLYPILGRRTKCPAVRGQRLNSAVLHARPEGNEVELRPYGS